MSRALFLGLFLPAQALAGGQVVAGHAIDAIDGGTGIGIEQQVVFGSDGGTTLTAATVRWAVEDMHVAVSLPYGAYNTPGGRDGSLGNLMIGGYYETLPSLTFGLEIHANIGEGAWTWTNAADELWPGAGARGVMQWRGGNEEIAVMARGALGIASARAVDPFPATRLQFEAAGAVDKPLGSIAGLTAEASLRAWDTSPFDLAAFGRVDPADGIRVRGGLVFPLATWAGLTPADRPAGVREATLVADISALF